MPSILFVCTANQLRSPIAAQVFEQSLPAAARKKWQVASAGTWTPAGVRLPRELASVALKLGVDLAGHKTVPVDAYRLEEFDWIVVMENDHLEGLTVEFPPLRQHIHLLTALAGEFPSDIPDPARLDEEGALALLREMAAMVKRLATKLKA